VDEVTYIREWTGGKFLADVGTLEDVVLISGSDGTDPGSGCASLTAGNSPIVDFHIGPLTFGERGLAKRIPGRPAITLAPKQHCSVDLTPRRC
jgi:predicted AAA+ superfamily ATPase